MKQQTLVPWHECDICTGEKCNRFLNGSFVVIGCPVHVYPKAYEVQYPHQKASWWVKHKNAIRRMKK